MRPRALAPAVLMVLLASGCGGSDDAGRTSPGDPSGSASSSASPSASPSATASPAEETPTLGPCDLLEPADYRRYLTAGFRKAAYEVEGLDLQTGTFRTCKVKASQTTLLSWGYSLDPEAWKRVRANTRPVKLEESDAFEGLGEALSSKRFDVMAGDEGFLFQTFSDLEGWFRIGDVALGFRPNAFGLPDDLTGADYGATMIALAAAAGDASALDMTPVDLPETCPPADSPAVVDVVGEVRQASGTAPDGLPASCDYLGASGTLLSTAGMVLPAPTFEAELGVDLPGSEVLETSRTRRTELYVNPRGGGSSLWDYHLRQRVLLDVEAVPPAWGPQQVDVGREAFIRFARAYRSLSEPVIEASG